MVSPHPPQLRQMALRYLNETVKVTYCYMELSYNDAFYSIDLCADKMIWTPVFGEELLCHCELNLVYLPCTSKRVVNSYLYTIHIMR